MEIRAGAGGEEAALWAGEIVEMYTKLATRHRWKTEVISSSPSDLGGFKDVMLEVRGKDAYTRLKHESGVHRVQRVPVTEAQDASTHRRQPSPSSPRPKRLRWSFALRI